MKSHQPDVKALEQTCSPGLDVAAYFGRLLLDYCSSQGLPAQVLLEPYGLDADNLSDADARIPVPTFLSLCCSAADRLKDPYLGLHVGASIEPGYLGPYGFTLMSARTGRELLAQTSRYSTIAINAGRNVIVENATECIRYWHSAIPDSVPGASMFCDMVMATLVAMGRKLFKQNPPLLNWVTFRHPAPIDDFAYREFFACPVTFGQTDYALSFDRRALDAALEHGNPQVAAVMNALCEKLLDTLRRPREPEWLTASRELIVELMKTRVPELHDVAAKLHVSPSTLRSRLAKQKLTYSQLLDDLRHNLALAYLDQPRLSLIDITFLLQYSEQSAFQRAFKRRAGCTPREYRQRAESSV